MISHAAKNRTWENTNIYSCLLAFYDYFLRKVIRSLLVDLFSTTKLIYIPFLNNHKTYFTGNNS